MAKGGKCGIHCISWILVIIGALNWGIIGLFDLDILNFIFGGVVWLGRLIYVIIGISAVVTLFDKKCGKCYLG